MPRNGSGGYLLPSPFPFQQNTTASATDVDTVLTDLQNAMASSVSKDGQTPMTGALQMNGQRVTGVAPAISPTDALTYGALQANESTSLGETLAMGVMSGMAYTADVTIESSNGTTIANQGTLALTAAGGFRVNGSTVPIISGSFTSLSGTGTYTVPANTFLLYIEAGAGGGSGGSGPSAANAGGPGGAGAIVRGFVPVQPGQTYAYSVGAGGAAASGTGGGNSGTLTSFGVLFYLQPGGGGPSYATWSAIPGAPYGGAGGSPVAIANFFSLIGSTGGILSYGTTPLLSIGGSNGLYPPTFAYAPPYPGCGSCGAYSGYVSTFQAGGNGFINIWT